MYLNSDGTFLCDGCAHYLWATHTLLFFLYEQDSEQRDELEILVGHKSLCQ